MKTKVLQIKVKIQTNKNYKIVKQSLKQQQQQITTAIQRN